MKAPDVGKMPAPTMVIPPDRRFVHLPLAPFCGSCGYLTRNGGGCPGAPPSPDAVAGNHETPMCHSIYDDGHEYASAAARGLTEPRP